MKKELKIATFDFEVTPQDWLVTIGDKTIVNNSLELIDFIEQNKKNTCFVGFNNKWFDNYCLKCIYYGVNPYKVVSETIINDGCPWDIRELKFKKQIQNLITMDLMDVTSNSLSLKEIEGNLGMEIKEAEINFNENKKLSKNDLCELIKYNLQDISATNSLFEQVKGEYNVKKTLCDIFNLEYTNISKTIGSLMGVILDTNNRPYEPLSTKYVTPSCIKLTDKTPINNFENQVFGKDDEYKFSHKVNNLTIDYGLGGGHGAINNFIFETTDEKVMFTLDVKQMYLSLMANKHNEEFRFYPRTIRSWQILSNLVDMRDKFVSEGKITEGDAIKKGGNSVYGKMLEKGKTFSDWENGRYVCITGQLILTMLCEYISKIDSVALIQVNTDGVFGSINKEDVEKLKEIVKCWENELKLSLKCNIINKGKIIQNNVNNYILWDKESDKIICKGKEVQKWNGGTYKSNSASIVDEALVKYFAYGKPINHTIMEAFDNNEVIKFQLIYARKGKNYTATYWGHKVVQKVNRVFPTTNKSMESLYKMKNGVRHKFTDIPEHCYLNNENVLNIKLNEIDLDLNYYINLAKNKISRWMGDKKQNGK